MTRNAWTLLVLAAVTVSLFAPAAVKASEVSGSFDHNGVAIYYEAQGLDWLPLGVRLQLSANSESQRMDRAHAWIVPDPWGDQPASFRGGLSVSGTYNAPLNTDSLNSSLFYNDGVRVEQSTNVSYDKWWDDWQGKLREMNYANASILLAPAVINYSQVSYYTWEQGGGGGGGGKGVVPPTDSLRGWEYQMSFGGYFTNTSEGEAFLASVPEPATLGLLAFGALFLRRRRH